MIPYQSSLVHPKIEKNMEYMCKCTCMSLPSWNKVLILKKIIIFISRYIFNFIIKLSVCKMSAYCYYPARSETDININ